MAVHTKKNLSPEPFLVSSNAHILLSITYTNVTDGQTDRRTKRHVVNNTSLAIAAAVTKK